MPVTKEKLVAYSPFVSSTAQYNPVVVGAITRVLPTMAGAITFTALPVAGDRSATPLPEWGVLSITYTHPLGRGNES